MDLFTTSSKMAGVSVPDDRTIDGVDLSETLFNQAPSPREYILFYRGRELFAVRAGAYRAHYITEGAYGMFGEK